MLAMSLSSGRSIISSLGNTVRSATSAATMAKPVNKPKYTVGTKLESDNTEKPAVIITVVYNIARPMLAWLRYMVAR